MICRSFMLLLYWICVISISTRGESAIRYSYDDKELLYDREGRLGSFFGTSVALNHQFLLVGSIGDGEATFKRSGSVYVYDTLKWNFLQKITPSDRGANYQFGTSIAMDEGDSTAVIGSPYAHIQIDGISVNSGLAHVFEVDKLLGLHREVIELYPFDGVQYDEFGKSVAICQNTIAVSSAHHDDGKGAVYIFNKNRKVWKNQSVLSIFNDDAIYFGHSLALTDKIIAVSSLRGNDARERSSVFVFSRPSTEGGIWSQNSRLFPSRGSPGDEFGISVSLRGDILAVGSRYDSFLNDKAGSVYMYGKSETDEWSETSILSAGENKAMGFFGDTVGIGDHIVAVGSFGWSGEDSDDIVGAVFIFSARPDNQWSEKTILLSSHGNNNDFFSKALAVYGNYIAVGAAGDDIPAMNSGSVFHFDLAAKYRQSQGNEDEIEMESHTMLWSAVILLSICCCCGIVGYFPKNKWVRRFCKKTFGISVSKKKSGHRRRHIRDINDMPHQPLKMDESSSGFDSAEYMSEDSVSDAGKCSSSIDLEHIDGEIESISLPGDNDFDHSAAEPPVANPLPDHDGLIDDSVIDSSANDEPSLLL